MALTDPFLPAADAARKADAEKRLALATLVEQLRIATWAPGCARPGELGEEHLP